jgi:PhnB protein
MKIVAYLNFDGQCEAAFKYYERLLGGKLEALMTFGSTPAAEGMPPSHKDKIMHARLVLAPGQELMGSDSPPGRHLRPSGVHVSLLVDSIAEGERIFRGLADGGTIEMPFEQTFWAPRFGMVVDRFGTPWMVNCEVAS